jgi:hypothetical protein
MNQKNSHKNKTVIITSLSVLFLSSTACNSDDDEKKDITSSVDMSGAQDTSADSDMSGAQDMSDAQDMSTMQDMSTTLPSCTDNIKNGAETGVDCGGGCAACMPTFEPRLMRIVWQWNGKQLGGTSGNIIATLRVYNFDNLAPDAFVPLYNSRRLIGGDCVAYVDADKTAIGTRQDYPALLPRGSRTPPSPGEPRADFLESGTGNTAISTNFLIFDETTGRYPDFERFVQITGEGPPYRAPGEVKFYLGNSQIFREQRHESPDRNFKIETDPVFALGGFTIDMSVADSPAGYYTFQMLGSKGQAIVHCAGAASGAEGRVSLKVPALNEIAEEIDWQAPVGQSAWCGETDIANPLLGGGRGVLEQAISGPANLAVHEGQNVCNLDL